MSDVLSESEQWDRIGALLAKGELPRRGRPKKGEDRLKWSDFGWTRQEAWRILKMGGIPEAEKKAFMEQRKAEGKPLSQRAILVHFGEINVISDDIYDGTTTGDLAKMMLEAANIECILPELTERQRRFLFRALHARLRQIAWKAEQAVPQIEVSEVAEQ
jgi:hypothetical protein